MRFMRDVRVKGLSKGGAMKPELRRKRRSPGDVRLDLACLLVAMMGLMPGLSMAEAWIVTPFVSLRTAYDDNIRFNTNNEDGGWRDSALVGGSYSRQTEDFELTGRATVDFTQYRKVEALFDDSLTGWDVRAITRKDFELQEIGGSFLFRKDDTFVTRSVFFDPADPGNTVGDNDGDAGLTRRPVPRKRSELDPYWDLRIDERQSVRFRGRYLDVRYDDDPDEGIDLIDYKAYGLDASYRYRLSEIESIRLSARYGHYKADEVGTKYHSTGATLTYAREFSELWRGEFEAGYRRTDYETPGKDGNDDGFILGTNLRYDGETSDFSFRYQRRQVPGGTGNVSRADDVRFLYRYDFTPRWSLTTEGQWLKTKAIDQDNSGSDRKYRNFIAGISYRFTPWLSLNGGYRYQWREFKRDDGDSAESNMVFVALQYNKALPLD